MDLIQNSEKQNRGFFFFSFTSVCLDWHLYFVAPYRTFASSRIQVLLIEAFHYPKCYILAQNILNSHSQSCLNPSICLDYIAKKGVLNIQSCVGLWATCSSKRPPRQRVWNEMVCKAPLNLNLFMIQQCWTFSFFWTMIAWASLLAFIAWQNFPCRDQWEQSNLSQVSKACSHRIKISALSSSE